MNNRDCVRCGTRLAGTDHECRECGATWPHLRMLEHAGENAHLDDALVWVLGAMLTVVTFFIVFVAW
ncbi:MAG: hypothetical protein ACYC28_06740 [Longimicrobiales bacterium]